MKLVTKKSNVANSGAPEVPVLVRDAAGRVLVRPRRRELLVRRTCFIGGRLRYGPCDEHPGGERFVLEGDEAISVWDPIANPDGVFDVLVDTPPVWGTIDGGAA